MRIIKTWCKNTEEGMKYLEFNGYEPVSRMTRNLWLVKKIGNELRDVEVVL